MWLMPKGLSTYMGEEVTLSEDGIILEEEEETLPEEDDFLRETLRPSLVLLVGLIVLTYVTIHSYKDAKKILSEGK